MFRRSPASDLSTDDKTRLDEMVNLIDQATSDILNSVDWSANMQLVDQVNATGNEIMYTYHMLLLLLLLLFTS
jgi:hypothetical protein